MNDISTLSVHLGDLALSDKQVEYIERQIRDMASHVCAQVATRKSHPSYGISKRGVRTLIDNMDGAIGLFMVLTAQATHTSVPNLAKFGFPETADRVETARRVFKDMP